VGNTLMIDPLQPQHPKGSLAALLAALAHIQAQSETDAVAVQTIDYDAGLLLQGDVVI
jgi:hypothetical protein